MKSARPVNPQLNWHLSAMAISPVTVKQLQEQFWFKRDEFANNTRCERTEYHGTFKGGQKAMTRELWDDVVALLAADQNFQGDLEEELVLPQYMAHVEASGNDASAITQITKRQIQPCPLGVYKECDIHLKVWWDKTAQSVRQALDGLEMISFDRPDEQGGLNRIYTLTFESLRDGLSHYEEMRSRLGRTQGIKARLKLEIASCFYRQPDIAIVLPIVRKLS